MTQAIPIIFRKLYKYSHIFVVSRFGYSPMTFTLYNLLNLGMGLLVMAVGVIVYFFFIKSNIKVAYYILKQLHVLSSIF